MKRIKKACDNCHKKVNFRLKNQRKKCSGNLPCETCKSKQLTCSYQILTKKRGPKRNKEIKEKASDLDLEEDEPNSYSCEKILSVANLVSEDLLGIYPHTREQMFHPLNTLKLNDHSALDWIELYFKTINNQYPIFSYKWFKNHHVNLPPFLLHVMQLMSISIPEVSCSNDLVLVREKLDSGCMKASQGAHFERNPFTLIALFLYSLYLFEINKHDWALTCISRCVSLYNSLGIGLGVEIRWKTKTNIVYHMDSPVLKTTLTTFRCILHEYFFSFKLLFRSADSLIMHFPEISPHTDHELQILHTFLNKWKKYQLLVHICYKIGALNENADQDTITAAIKEMNALLSDSMGLIDNLGLTDRYSVILYQSVMIIYLWPNIVNGEQSHELEYLKESISYTLEHVFAILGAEEKDRWIPSSFYICVYTTAVACCLLSAKISSICLKAEVACCIEILNGCAFFPEFHKDKIAGLSANPSQILVYPSFFEILY